MTSHNDGHKDGPKDGHSKTPPQAHKDAAKPAKNDGSPEWAGGLRQLYDSVVEEPLPDTFKDLLSKLDDSSK